MAKSKENISGTKPKHPGGRPLLFKTPAELEAKIEAYFESCYRPMINLKTNEIVHDAQGNVIIEQYKPFTISGLAVALDTSRKVLMEYQAKDEFSNAIMRAKRKCENYTEEALFRKESVQGAKFVLINGYGFAEKQEITQNTPSAVNFDVKKLTNDDLAYISNALKRINKPVSEEVTEKNVLP